jgi:hypothetical protein
MTTFFILREVFSPWYEEMNRMVAVLKECTSLTGRVRVLNNTLILAHEIWSWVKPQNIQKTLIKVTTPRKRSG